MTANLTASQYAGYLQWKNQDWLIQDALPDLDAATREMIITGLSNEDFHKATRSDEE
jgi:hypothetical protein